MPRTPPLLLPLVLLAVGCTSRPHHRQNFAFGIEPFVGLRGPSGPTGMDIELFPPAAYANVFRLVSANISADLVELYVFPVCAGWRIGPGVEPQPRREEPPPPPKEKRKEKEEPTEKPVDA
jgi:hypothetical protein